MSNLSQNDKSTLDNLSGMSIGNIFKKARESQGLNIQQIAAHLNIGSTHLEAIEENDMEHLPPKVYAVGFVRAYADLLGLDSEKMAYLFKVQVYGKKQTDHEKHIVKSEGKSVQFQDMLSSKLNLVPFVLAGLVAVGFVGGVLYLLIGWILTPSNEGQLGIPDVPLDMMEQISQPNQDFVTNDGDNDEINPVEPMDIIIKPDDGRDSYGVEPLQSALTFKFLQDNWVEIRSVKNGKLLISKTLKQGDVFYIAADQDILLTTGNAGAIEAYLDGQKLGALGAEGDVVRLRPFSVKALRLQSAG